MCLQPRSRTEAVMAVLLLDYYEGGNVGKTAAFSLVQTVLLAVLLGITTWLSRGSAESMKMRLEKAKRLLENPRHG